MPQGIQVGDAVLNFFANTESLDQGFAKVDSTPAHLKPAEEELVKMADDWTFMGQSARTAGTEGMEASLELEEGTKKAAFSMREAKGEMALLGEETGVKLPRHIRSFVAELPGVGKAMEAAFSATAALILIQVLVEGAKKLTEFISDTFIFTESMKKSDEVTKEMNKELLLQKDALSKVNKEMEVFGTSGSKKTQIAINDLNEEIKKNKEAFYDANNMVGAYRMGISVATPEAVEKAKIAMVTLTSEAKTQAAALELLTKTFEREQTDELVKGEEQRIAIRRKMADITTEITYQQQRTVIAQQKGGYILEVANEQQKAESLYQTEKSSLQQRLELTKFAGDKEKEQRTAILAQLEALEKQHQLKAIQAFADLQVRLRALAGTAEVTRSELTNVITDPMVEKYKKLQDAAKSLGLVLYGDLKVGADASRAALDQLAKEGALSSRQLAQAKLAVVQADIKVAQASDKNTAALKKEEAQLKKLIGEEKEHGKVAQQTANAVGQAITAEAFAFGQGAVTIGQAMRDITSMIVKEIAKQAEVKGADAFADGLSMAAVGDPGAGMKFAAAAGWFALAGGISMAAGAIAGQGAKPGSAANPVNVTGTAGASTNQQPRGPINTSGAQSFASGGLITQPTMAILGDRPNSKGEVAFDLDDKRSIDAIREALGGGGDGGIHVHVKGLISGDNLGTVITKISRRVKKGQSHLLSSNSHRVTRRSV